MFIWGTLLGFTRSNSFLEQDDDLDFLIAKEHSESIIQKIQSVVANSHSLRLDYSKNIAILQPKSPDFCQVDL